MKEDWEYYYPQMMSFFFIAWGVIWYYQPIHSPEDVARDEAIRRIAARKKEAEEA